MRRSPSRTSVLGALLVVAAGASCMPQTEPRRQTQTEPEDEPKAGSGGSGGRGATGGRSGGTDAATPEGSGGSGGGGSGGGPLSDAGADRNAPSGDAPGTLDTMTAPAAPKLSTDVAPIAKMRCAVAGCHDPVKKEHGMDVSTPMGIMTSWVNKMTADHCQNNKTVTRVVPGKPEESFVIKLITSTNYCSEIKRMPPPPLATLTPAQIQTIRDWVAAGARND